MNIDFTAIEVEYNEAIDGEIIQASFDEGQLGQDQFNGRKYLTISQNYEFPGKPTLEWNDGKGDDGGSEVLNYKLENDLLELTTTDGLMFRIRHNCSEKVLAQIQEFFKCEFTNSHQI